MGRKGEFLVAILNNPVDLELARAQHWYRIPVTSVAKWLARCWPPEALAFYQTKVFGEEAFTVRHWAGVREIRQVLRTDLFPDLHDDRSERRYYQLLLEPLQQLERPIASRRWRRIVFIPTDWARVQGAEEINDLFYGSSLEERLWHEFKRVGIVAEREDYVSVRDHSYFNDFSLYCARGNVDVETDGDHWHATLERAGSDNLRNNDLQTAGWSVLRFTGKQIREELQEYCMPTVCQEVERLGGLETGGMLTHTSNVGVARQASLFDVGTGGASDGEQALPMPAEEPRLVPTIRSAGRTISLRRIAEDTPEYITQYSTPAPLNARINLHARFSTNPQGWFRWAFDQLDLPTRARILELGCGTGALWLENQERIPLGWQSILTDLFAGMLRQAQIDLAGTPSVLCFAVSDAQAIPLGDASVDAVIANHMLYHVPNRSRAVEEVRRVLGPGGVLYAATVGRRHLVELQELVQRFDATVEAWRGGATAGFVLENGAGQLRPCFDKIELRRYEDALVVTEAQLLADYVLSAAEALRVGERPAQLLAFLQAELAVQGAIRITKDTGMFIARG